MYRVEILSFRRGLDLYATQKVLSATGAVSSKNIYHWSSGYSPDFFFTTEVGRFERSGFCVADNFSDQDYYGKPLDHATCSPNDARCLRYSKSSSAQTIPRIGNRLLSKADVATMTCACCVEWDTPISYLPIPVYRCKTVFSRISKTQKFENLNASNSTLVQTDFGRVQYSSPTAQNCLPSTPNSSPFGG